MPHQARHIDWEYLGRAGEAAVAVGELVSVEAGGWPIYRVMAIDDGRARLRDIDGGGDHVTALTAFHWKAGEPRN